MIASALFSLGNFWNAQDVFDHMDGIVETKVGYCAGTSDAPSFLDPGDHVEALLIDYDATLVSYDELLDQFWGYIHDDNHLVLSQDAYDRRYSLGIYYLDESQHIAATRAKDRHYHKNDERMTVAIDPAGRFYEAEAYNQGYIHNLQDNK